MHEPTVAESRARALAVGLLLFVAGAASLHFEIPPGPFLRDAFSGGAAYAERWTGMRQGRREPTYAFHPESQGSVRQGDLGGDLLLLSTTGGPAAFLIDGTGAVRHRWALPFSEVWPDPPHVLDPVPDSKVSFQRVRLLPGGDLVAVYHGGDDSPFGYGAVRMDRRSRVVWRHAGRAHHDLDVGPDGRIYLLEHEFSELPVPAGLDVRKKHLRDSLTVLTADGAPERRVDLVAAFEGTEFEPLLHHRNPPAARWGEGERLRNPGPQRGDLLHTNSVRVLLDGVAYPVPGVRAGQVLLSIREPSVVAVLDPQTAKVVWATRGPWRAQHEARFLPNGRLVLFDNAGAFPPGRVPVSVLRSRVIQYDVPRGAIVWSYEGTGLEPMYSPTRGTVHLLADGGALLAASDAGRVQRITGKGKLLWEYQTFGKGDTITTAMLVRPDEAEFLHGD